MMDKVTVIEFDDKGKKLDSVEKEKIVNQDWKKILPDLCYKVTREHATERAFSISGYENTHPGLYRCICCNNALFSNENKYNSYTGWPSFWQPISRENVDYNKDNSLGIVRIEVCCALCDAHLGHIFDDGPEPTGLRYCINMSALKFIPY